MEPFSIGNLRVLRPYNGSYLLVKAKAGEQDSEADTSADTTTVTTADGKVVTHSRHHASDDFPIAVVPALAIVFTFIWLIVKALMAPFTQKGARRGHMPVGGTSAGLTDEEQAVLLKLQRTLTDMEQRIESLETILIDEHRTKEKYGNKI